MQAHAPPYRESHTSLLARVVQGSIRSAHGCRLRDMRSGIIRYFSLFVAFTLLEPLTQAQNLPSGPPELQVPYRLSRLTNGLTVILHQDRSVPVVSVNVWYHVGSANEKPGRTGFAHLFEHL